MKKFINNTSIASRFLQLTLPPIALVAIVLLTILAWYNIVTVQQQEQGATEEVAIRYARILSRPMWNLESNGTRDVLSSLMEEPDIQCLTLIDYSDVDSRTSKGSCLKFEENYEEYETKVLFLHKNKLEPIGSLYIQKQTTDIIAKMYNILLPQIIVTIVTFALLIFFVLIGFRRSVTRPLSAIQQSIYTFEEIGKRRQVEWKSSDELGQLISVYNASLYRQEMVESELKDQLAVTNSLLNTIPQPISFLSSNKRFLRCNDSFSRLFGLSSAEIIGITPKEILENSPWDLLPTDLDAYFDRNDKVFTEEVEISLLDQKSIDVIFSCGALRDADGKIDGLVSVMQDITERKHIETEIGVAKNEVEVAYKELQVAQDNLIHSEKMASLGSLVAGVSHEINTPLGSSITVASTIDERTKSLRKDLSQGQLKKSSLEEFLHVVEEASNILNRSLKNAAELVRSFKQVAVDQTSSKRRPFDLDTSIKEVLATVQPTYKKSPYQLNTNLNCNAKMNSYPGALGQVISNLAHNSILHAFEGRIFGIVLIESSFNEKENTVCITINDNGIGIAENNVNHIFDPFFTTKMGQGGTGLGLNVVYNIVNTLLGGTITVESELGVGTTFTILVPCNAPDSVISNITS